MCVCVHMQSPSVHCTISLVCAFTNRVYYAHTTEVSSNPGRASPVRRGLGRPRKDPSESGPFDSAFAASAPSCGSGSTDPAESTAAAPFQCRPSFGGIYPPLDLSPPPRPLRASQSIASPPSGPRRSPSAASTPRRQSAAGSTPKRSPLQQSPESQSAKRARIDRDAEYALDAD